MRLFGIEITQNNVSSSSSSSGEESRSVMGGGRNISSSSSSKGRRWSEDEQKAFLIGLEKLGKGNWVGISRDFVPSRTPTQVASHAQKYFDRQKENRVLKRHKSSVFDINLDEESSTTSNTCVVPLNESNNKGKEPLNETTPISPMPVSYRASWVSFNGNYAYAAYVPTTNYPFIAPNFVSSSTNVTPVHRVSSQSNSASVDNLDLTL